MKTFLIFSIATTISISSFGVGLFSRQMVDTQSYRLGFLDGAVKARAAAHSSYDGDFELEHRKVSGSEEYQDGFGAGHQNGYGRGNHACQDAVDAIYYAAKLTGIGGVE